MTYEPPAAPYVQAVNQGGRQKPTMIILRPSLTNSENGAALAVAQYWHRSSSFWEAGHYTVDNKKRFRCVRDNVIAGKKNVDKGAIRVAICAEPASREVFWDSDTHGRVLAQTAKLVAELTLAYKIKPDFIDEEAFSKWQKLRLRRRGGIYVAETNGFPFYDFLKEVNVQRILKTHI